MVGKQMGVRKKIKTVKRRIRLKIRSAIRYGLYKNKSKAKLEKFLSQFRKHYVSCDLIRIGGDNDGGYLLPNILDDISYCFSPGVAQQADFEKELSEKFKIKSFMADASVDNLPLSDENFEFIPKFLGSLTSGEFITLSDWLNQSEMSLNKNMILQMDIEGGEYDVLVHEDSEVLKSFSIMVIEFHNLHKLFDENFLRMVSAIFEKIYKNFSICHVHINNFCYIETSGGIEVPPVIEVSFIRNDLIDKVLSEKPISLPHNLDSRNSLYEGDTVMPEIWWKS